MTEKIIFLFVFLSFLTLKVNAQPNQISVHGVLKDSSGNKLNGSFVMSFYFYETEDSTTPIYSFTPDQKVEVTNGVFNVKIDLQDQEIFKTYQTLWLGVKIENEKEFPRIKIVSSGYSIHSKYADKLTGKFSVMLGDGSENCTENNRGELKFVKGNSGFGDKLMLCYRDASGNYKWKYLVGSDLILVNGAYRYADGADTDCEGYYKKLGSTGNLQDGLYWLDPDADGQNFLKVYCDMKNGGWMLLSHAKTANPQNIKTGSGSTPTLSDTGALDFDLFTNGNREFKVIAGSSKILYIHVKENGNKYQTSTAYKYQWQIIQRHPAYHNDHCSWAKGESGWNDCGVSDTITYNYIASGDCYNCYQHQLKFIGNGRSGYYSFGNTYDYDFVDFTGLVSCFDYQCNTLDFSEVFIWCK